MLSEVVYEFQLKEVDFCWPLPHKNPQNGMVLTTKKAQTAETPHTLQLRTAHIALVLANHPKNLVNITAKWLCHG